MSTELKNGKANARKTPTGTITRRELSKQLGLSYHTLATWVRQHRGPPFIRATTRGQVWYRTEDVATWLADRATGNGYLGEQPSKEVQDLFDKYSKGTFEVVEAAMIFFKTFDLHKETVTLQALIEVLPMALKEGHDMAEVYLGMIGIALKEAKAKQATA